METSERVKLEVALEDIRRRLREFSDKADELDDVGLDVELYDAAKGLRRAAKILRQIGEEN
jgi:hypothetical protein